MLAALGFYAFPQSHVEGGRAFVLHDGAGEAVRDTDYLGRYLVIYFGYTNCPDVCPLALGRMAAALNLLGAQRTQKLAVLFVSLDPGRDSGERLREYGKAFHPLVTAVTGDRAAIDHLTQAYGARYQLVANGNNGEYSVDHTSVFYLVGPDGRYLRKISASAKPDVMAEALLAGMKQ